MYKLLSLINLEGLNMAERIQFYKSLLGKDNNNDHVICIKLGEYLNAKSHLSRNTEEELAVSYFNRCIKHKEHSTHEPRLKNASEILVAIENSYVRDYGCQIQDFE